jgi:hypothetical protein
MRLRPIVVLWILFGSACFAQAKDAKPVSGCELLKHPGRFNGKMVVVEGTNVWGYERGDLNFPCPGRIGIQLSLTAADDNKYGFRTEQESVDLMSQLPPGERPGDNLTTRKLQRAQVKVVGLFRCHYDFPTCKDASLDDGSIIVKSMQFESPITDLTSAAEPNR